MLPGVVFIDLPEQTPRVWVEALTSACQAALGPGRCVEGPEARASYWRATVIAGDDASGPVLRVELYDGDAGRLESARRLRFQEIDPERQRWASAGVVIAAMVSAGEAGRTLAPEPIDVAPLDAPPPAPERPLSEPARPKRLWVDAAALVERGFASRPPGLGARIDVGSRPTSWPLLLGAGISASWTRSPLDSFRVTAGAGPGWRLLDGAVAWDVSAQARVQRYAVFASRTQEGVEHTDSGSEWRSGAALNTRVAFRVLDSLGLFLDADGGWYLPEIPVTSENRPVGRVAPFNFGIAAGLRWIAPT